MLWTEEKKKTERRQDTRIKAMHDDQEGYPWKELRPYVGMREGNFFFLFFPFLFLFLFLFLFFHSLSKSFEFVGGGGEIENGK